MTAKAKRRIDSRAKGGAGEREFAAMVFEQLGVTLQRRLEQCRSGGFDLEAIGDCPVAKVLQGFAIECKRHRTATPGQVSQWWSQAESQARSASRTPALAYRADRQAWRVLVPLAAINGAVFQGAWDGYGWTGELSLEAFATLVRELANTSIADHGGRGCRQTNLNPRTETP